MTARCLCGAVRFEAEIISRDIHLCHCAQCQRWTGGGPLTAVRVKDVQVTGEDNVAAYHASEYGERGFCRVCGTTLYWKMQGKPIGFLPVGLFNDQSGFRVTKEIFVDCRPDWLPHHDGAKQSTEAEQMQMLASYLATEEGQRHDEV